MKNKLSRSQTRMLKEFITPTMMLSSSLCLLLTIQLEGCWGQWEVGKNFVLPFLSTNEAWTRSTSSSELTLDGFRWNESAARGHCHITCSGGGISTIGNQGREFPCG